MESKNDNVFPKYRFAVVIRDKDLKIVFPYRVVYYISKKKDDDKGLSRVLKGDKCEIAQRESFRVGSSLGKNDFRQQRLCTIHSLYTSL